MKPLLVFVLVALASLLGTWLITRPVLRDPSRLVAVLNGPCKELKVGCGDDRGSKNLLEVFQCPEIVIHCIPTEEDAQ